MATKGTKKKPAKKRKRKNRTPKRSFFVMLRQWSLPLFLLFLMGFSLAAAFYLIFLHTPSTPLF
jgi:cell division septal protein FtsQ